MRINEEILTVTERRTPFLQGYEDFVKIKSNYIVGNGIMIDDSANVLWNRVWKHSFFKMQVHMPSQTIIMDRLAMIGPMTLSAGICGVNLLTGKYLWKYWYQFELFERIAFLEKKKSIKLENLDDAIYSETHLFTHNFAIHIKSGNFSRTSSTERGSSIEPDIPEIIVLKKINLNNELIFKLPVIDVNKLKYCFEDNFGLVYCILENPNIILIFKQYEIFKKIHLLFDILELKMYDYFGKGVLLYVKTPTIYKLCVMPIDRS